MKTGQLEIVPASPSDAQELLAIYAPYVTDTAITFEYEVPTVEEFARRMENILAKYPYLKAVSAGKTVGYAYASAFKDRAAYDWSVETSIYVDGRQRGGGIGGSLYSRMEDILKGMHILNLNACIAIPGEETTKDSHVDMNSVRFHAHLGYQTAGHFHHSGYKFGTWYDMVWMEKMIGTHTGHPEEVIPFPEWIRSNGYTLI